MKNNKRVGGLYLCQFSQGTVKVGVGADAAARLASHKAAGAVFGITVVRTDVIPCELPRKAEKLLIEWCASNSTAINGREWFDGLNYEACFAAAKSAAAAMMGPHPYERSKADIAEAIIASFSRERTKEAVIYGEARDMMVASHAGRDMIAALNYLHSICESVRSNMRVGAPMPEWYDLLNCFMPWEIELWFDEGRPSPELLKAAADAIQSIAIAQEAKGVAHA